MGSGRRNIDPCLNIRTNRDYGIRGGNSYYNTKTRREGLGNPYCNTRTNKRIV